MDADAMFFLIDYCSLLHTGRLDAAVLDVIADGFQDGLFFAVGKEAGAFLLAVSEVGFRCLQSRITSKNYDAWSAASCSDVIPV
ncbi:MAG: hypothetical protein IJU37_04055 [Desulfovibrio sp.]|nr:hypothetical protein [Desulfovibrio sp.]